MQANTAASVELDDIEALGVTESNANVGVAPESASVLLHVRFRPDASILQIDECPEDLSIDSWFKRLSARAGDKYATRAGGRGFFRLSRMELDALKTQRPN